MSFSYGGTSYVMKVNKVFYTFSIHGLFVFEETLPTLTSTRTNAWVNLKDGADVDEISSNIKSLSNVSNCITYSEMSDKINGYMDSIQSMTLAIKVFAIILAIIVLINLGVLNFNERIRDIATLRVLGFRNRQIGKSLLYEAMFSTIIGSLLGIFLGMPMLYVVLGTNKTPLVTFYYYIKPESYVFAVLLSILTAFIVNLLLNSRVKKVSMSESLKSVE